MTRVAIIGSGIAGLAAAWALRDQVELTLFEAGDHFGGHAHTVDVTLEGQRCGVDTGFLVLNPRTYPGLLRLFGELGIEPVPSDMSFSVQAPRGGLRPLEWCGSGLAGLAAQPTNLLRPSFWGMLADIARFNREATALALAGDDGDLRSVGDFLERGGYGRAFIDWYFLPMAACIWSCPTAQMLRFPMLSMARFCHNHALLQLRGRPQWLTVPGGSRRYVERIIAALPDARLHSPVRSVRRDAAGVMVVSDRGSERFDAVIMACHSDQSLALLADAGADETQVLGAVRYQANQAVLHTDTSLLPRSRRAWAAWNYESGGDRRVCLHYLLNKLQPLPWSQPLMVSLNPVRQPEPSSVLARFDYAHPVFDRAAIAAQRRLPWLQGQRRTFYCGAWTGYGFHEDGLQSGLAAAHALLRDVQDRLERAA